MHMFGYYNRQAQVLQDLTKTRLVLIFLLPA